MLIGFILKYILKCLYTEVKILLINENQSVSVGNFKLWGISFEEIYQDSH